MKKRNSARMTEEDLKKIMQNKSLKIVETKIKSNNFSDLIKSNEVNDKKQVRAIDIKKKINSSLRTSSITVDGSKKKGNEFITILFEGARALSLNEILNASHKRHYEIINYKKEWKNLILKAITLLPHNKRFYFDSPCKITLYRQGKKEIDLDGFQAIFKYAIDSLRYAKILSDDNPKIMFLSETIQNKGNVYALGIKIEKIQDFIEPEKIDIEKIKKIWNLDNIETFNFDQK